MWAEGGQWELAGGMSTPSVLTVNQSPAPATGLASPALTSQILFCGHKMGQLSLELPSMTAIIHAGLLSV